MKDFRNSSHRHQLPQILNELVSRVHVRKLTNLLNLTQVQFDPVNGYSKSYPHNQPIATIMG